MDNSVQYIEPEREKNPTQTHETHSQLKTATEMQCAKGKFREILG